VMVRSGRPIGASARPVFHPGPPEPSAAPPLGGLTPAPRAGIMAWPARSEVAPPPRSRSRPVARPARQAPDARSSRPPATLALLGLWLACGPGAAMASGSSLHHPSPAATSAPEGGRSAHHCRCGTSCSGKCCCAPRERLKPALGPASKPASGAPGVGRASGPCWASSPCGGGALPPVARAVVGIGDPAAGADRPRVEAGPKGPRLAPPSSDRAEGSSPGRVDEPPERPDDA